MLLGFGEVFPVFFQTPQVVEQHAAALSGQVMAQGVLPSGQRLGFFTLAFQQQPEVDGRLVQLGVEGVGFFVGLAGAELVAAFEQHGMVEMDGRCLFLFAVEKDDQGRDVFQQIDLKLKNS